LHAYVLLAGHLLLAGYGIEHKGLDPLNRGRP
jgi:hypothetical protein